MSTDSAGGELHWRPSAVAFVVLGAAVGALARVAIQQAWPTPSGGFPFSTLSINLSGALLLGLLLEILALQGDDEGWRRSARLLLGTGFCGAFTTYSTLAVETDLLLRDHAIGVAASYAAISVGGGLLTAAAGIGLALAVHTMWQSRKPPRDGVVGPDEAGA